MGLRTAKPVHPRRDGVREACLAGLEIRACIRGLAGETGERSQTQTQDTDRYIEYITETATDVNRVSNLESV